MQPYTSGPLNALCNHDKSTPSEPFSLSILPPIVAKAPRQINQSASAGDQRSPSSCSVSFSPSAPLSLLISASPCHSHSCRSHWTGHDFVRRSAWFSVEMHTPAVITPRPVNCCSQKTFVDKCRLGPTPLLRQIPRAALSSKSSKSCSLPLWYSARRAFPVLAGSAE